MEDMIRMSKRESERREVISQVIHGKLKQTEAANLMRLSYRQTNRMVNAYKREGVRAVIHKNRGKPSPRKITDALKQRIYTLYAEKYADFGPTFAREKLRDMHHISIGKETLRTILIEQQLWEPKKHSQKQCHVWREGKKHAGELIQVDGSHHRWLEERLDQEFCLMAYIDDATGIVFARFYAYEGVMPFLESFQRFVKKYGIPHALYLDRHSTYLTTRQASVDEELRNVYPETQVERVVKLLGSQCIHAHSPQAKGRVERLFATLQDRLVKELRLAHVCTIDDANAFLEQYLVQYNQRFAVPAAESASFFRPMPSDLDHQWTFAIRDTRIVGSDYTIRWCNRIFLIKHPVITHRRKQVEIKQALDGSLRFSTKTTLLRVEEITEKDDQRRKQNYQMLNRLSRDYAYARNKKSWMDSRYIGTAQPFV